MQSSRQYSFIVPTYNSERWIKDCVNSILQQTIRGFDIIILDSGSTDGTLPWLQSLNQPNLRIYPAAGRLDIVANWSRVMQVPRNEFMTILGHDDILYADYLQTIDALIDQHPNAGLYQTQFNFIDDNNVVIRHAKPMAVSYNYIEFTEAFLQNRVEITATGFMFRSKDYDAAGGIPPYPKLLFADIAVWISLIKNTYLAVATATCFAFRFHQNNTSKSAGIERLHAFDQLIDFLINLGQQDANCYAVIKRFGPGFLREYVSGACHKLIYVDRSNRNGVTMHQIIQHSKLCAARLLPGLHFEPGKFPQIIVAKWIDAIPLLRKSFLFIKSFKKRTY